ncbi:MAG: glycosyltransferase family 2 protein [Phycisphaerales bacterium]|nr:glycosyltransferase family 2 protein [Phycisphaerales bacterium]
MSIELSIVSPAYNEAEGLAEFVQQVHAAVTPLDITWELILINDGSRDASLQAATNLAAKDPHLRIVSFSRNFGHEAASTAGLRYARGKAVVLIDSDLQDPPDVIPQMFAKWREGFQIIYGVRSKRHEETPLKRITSWLFYRLMRRMAKIDLPRDTGDFRLIDRRVVDAFNRLPERNRFVRGLICWTGFRSIGIPFIRAPRFAGKTKYNYPKLIRLAIDSLTGFTTAPLKIATWLGMLIGSSALTWILVIICQFFFWRTPTGDPYRPAGFTFLYIAVLLLGGVQIFLIGLVGEYLARTYEQVQGRPLYIVDSLIGFTDTPAAAGVNGSLLPETPRILSSNPPTAADTIN